MSTFPVYLDIPRYLNNAAHGLEVGSLLGGNSTLSSSYAIGATSLGVASGTGYVAGDAWILDGLNSETVTITNVVSNTLTIASPGLVAAHNARVSISQASANGTGCLADIIVQASREIDNICRQGPDGSLDRSLYAISRTEILEAPYRGAAFTVDNALAIHPYHFPVQSVTSVNTQVGAGPSQAVNLQYMYLVNGARAIKVPWAQLQTNTAMSLMITPYSRNAETAVTLTYVGGPIVGTTCADVPPEIQRACMLLVNDILSLRKNPLGAAFTHRGDENYGWEQRGEQTGHSLNFKNAESRLRPWIRMV